MSRATVRAVHFAFLLPVVCVGSLFPADAAAQVQALVVFEREHSSGSSIDIWIREEGGAFVNVTNTQFRHERDPKFCGTDKIIFTADSNGLNEFDLFMMDTDGQNEVNITAGAEWDSSNETFAECGALVDGLYDIVFVSNRGYSTDDEVNWELWKIRSNGTESLQLTSNTMPDSHPTWCGDGIVFHRDRFLSEILGDELFFLDFGHGAITERNLTQEPGHGEFEPDCSPDNTQIVFRRNLVYGPLGEIFRMPLCKEADANGDGIPDKCPFGTRLTHNDDVGGGACPPSLPGCIDDREPNWSPAGDFIVFVSDIPGESNPDANFELFLMNSVTGDQPVMPTQITVDDSIDDLDPSWEEVRYNPE